MTCHNKKIKLKIVSILIFLQLLLSMSFTNSFGSLEIADPAFIKAINTAIKEYFTERSTDHIIMEADIPYVKALYAKDLGITDISGLEQFNHIISTIDLSNNNITDITPLINWVRNKNDENLSANIFIGENPILSTENYKQIYTLSNMGKNIKIYDSKREGGEGVFDLTGFVDGRPVDMSTFDQNNKIPNVKQSVNQIYENHKIEPSTSKVSINTGMFEVSLIVCYFIIILIGCLSIYKYFIYKQHLNR